MFNIPKVNFKVVKNDPSYGVFEAAPLIKGFGYSLGNALRRTLFSATVGAAITKVRIDGVSHQFSTIEGAKDDVLHMLLNLKKVRFAKTVEGPVELELTVSKQGDVIAGDIEDNAECKVVNKDLVITSLADKKNKIKAYLTVESGYGYVQAPELDNVPVGTILLDASFSPVVNVSMTVDEHRVGRDTNYDKLTLIVQTDGSSDPETLLREASKALKEYFYRIQTGADYSEEEDASMVVAVTDSSGKPSVPADEIALEELHLPTRTINALRKAGIKTLGDLADRSEDDLLRIRNLGEKSIKEILSLLERENLK